MARTPFSLLLLRRVTHYSLKVNSLPLSFSFSQLLTTNRFSTSEAETPPSSPKPSSLSARLAFVYEQIDAIEKERAEKDQTLQRIRAWRESKKAQASQNDVQKPESASGVFTGNGSNSDEQLPVDLGTDTNLEIREGGGTENGLGKKELELVHPWPEWIELMERLVQQNYFDHRRKDEDKMVRDLGFDVAKVRGHESFELIKDFKTVQTAFLNFGKDRFDILRSLPRRDIQILVGFGCPNVDKKVVFSAKLLRKLVHLDEGDVCSSCSLRNSCERGYLITNKEDEARTIDIMRVLLTFGFDPGNGLITNKQLLEKKFVRTVIRKLFHEIVKLSSVPIDPNLPPPVIKRPPPKVKQPPPPPRKRVGRDDIEMKKGDWLCPKCDFMNFAKNTVCLQCDAKRPKRVLLPGEWECPECKFLNYRRNMVCFHCECKRPPDEFLENNRSQSLLNPKKKQDKIANRSEVSNAWNFDFDDDESDGADVAAFEYADSRTIDEHSPLNGHSQGSFRGPEGDFKRFNRAKSINGEEFDGAGYERPGMAFNDFDDDDDDDIDSYEIETQSNSSSWKASTSEVGTYSGLSNMRSDFIRGEASHFIHQKTALSASEDDGPDFNTDEDLPVHRNWRSTHVADAQHITKNRVPRNTQTLNFGSDEELGPSSDVDDDFGRKHRKGRTFSDIEDDLLSGSELKNDDLSRISKRDSAKTSRRGYNLEARDTGRGKRMLDDRGRGRHQFNDSRKGGFSKQQQRRLGRYNNDGDFGEFRNKSHGFPNRQRRSADRYDTDGDFSGFGNFRPGPLNQQQRRSDRYDKSRDFGEFRNNSRRRGLPKQRQPTEAASRSM